MDSIRRLRSSLFGPSAKRDQRRRASAPYTTSSPRKVNTRSLMKRFFLTKKKSCSVVKEKFFYDYSFLSLSQFLVGIPSNPAQPFMYSWNFPNSSVLLMVYFSFILFALWFF